MPRRVNAVALLLGKTALVGFQQGQGEDETVFGLILPAPDGGAELVDRLGRAAGLVVKGAQRCVDDPDVAAGGKRLLVPVDCLVILALRAVDAAQVDPRVRRAAVSKLMAPALLAAVAREDCDETVRAQAAAMPARPAS